MIEVVITHLSGSRRNAVETFGALPLKLGRAEDCDVKFDAEVDLKVSAHHAEMRSDGQGGLLVVDLSKNGVLVNGAKVEGTAALPNHAVVELGADGPRLKVKFETMGSGGISFSKLKKAAAAAEAAPPDRLLRTTAEAEAYTESELGQTPPAPTGGGAKTGLVVAVVLLLVAGAALAFVLTR